MSRSEATLHPFTILSLGIAGVVVTTAVGSWPLSCAVIAVSFAVAGWQKKLGKLSALSAALIVPTMGSQLLIHGLVASSEVPALFEAGPVRVTAAGLEIALLLGLRTAVLVVVGLLCVLLIDIHDLVAAIDMSKAPPQLGYLLASTLFLLPQLARKQKTIGQAQQLRHAGTGSGVRGWFQRLRLRAVPLVLGSLEDASLRAPHLAARGFPAKQATSRLRTLHDSGWQRAMRFTALGVAVLGPLTLLLVQKAGV
ncbi:energy-coupling factor transporter transmembrane component T family protein [Glutamicibacter sp. NPDC087344]|uniref:energy-coupling factor transporter transmembrane component T family protein n=1 Tax=Glutamicibacter sp. NPDC087344 TaxID=3363994 RepID=UPI0038010BC4